LTQLALIVPLHQGPMPEGMAASRGRLSST
jgi:hypothetical protein